jgi:hypothetical protein
MVQILMPSPTIIDVLFALPTAAGDRVPALALLTVGGISVKHAVR